MWCKTQAVVDLRSAEAELCGLVRASAETMGLISMYKDFGTPMNGLVLGDASGPTRAGQIEASGHQLFVWIQEKAAKGDLDFKKVAGVDTGADLFTKDLVVE